MRFYHEPIRNKAQIHPGRAEPLLAHLVGPLCRNWPESAPFDKVFDKGWRQSGLNRWFWDKLYLAAEDPIQNTLSEFAGKFPRERLKAMACENP
jgi:hypothetical protein